MICGDVTTCASKSQAVAGKRGIPCGDLNDFDRLDMQREMVRERLEAATRQARVEKELRAVRAAQAASAETGQWARSAGRGDVRAFALRVARAVAALF